MNFSWYRGKFRGIEVLTGHREVGENVAVSDWPKNPNKHSRNFILKHDPEFNSAERSTSSSGPESVYTYNNINIGMVFKINFHGNVTHSPTFLP
jgi:hypothetical protein